MAGRLQGKVAFVAGAGSSGPGWGNGKAAAVLFAREGAKVFAVDVHMKAAEETADIIEKDGGACIPHACDLRKARHVADAVEGCLKAFGRIDVLQNNVGGSDRGGPVEMSEEAWDAQFDLNLRTAFLTSKYVLPHMDRQQGGSLVHVSSVAGIRYVGREVVGYAASKAALIAMSRSIALQYVRRNVRSNCVLPGYMNTPLIHGRIARQQGPEAVAQRVAERDALCPSGKMGDAWDVAYASLFLASDEAKYVTGTELIVDGGLTAQCMPPNKT